MRHMTNPVLDYMALSMKIVEDGVRKAYLESKVESKCRSCGATGTEEQVENHDCKAYPYER